jgi:iron complex outermembrane receptor protein
MKGLTWLIFIILGFTLYISAALAEEVPREITLEEIVVTATRTPRVVEDVPGRVEVITKEQIEQYVESASKVDDILQNASGLDVVRGNGIYSLGASATLRGLSNEQARTLVMIDGVPINKSDTGEVNFNRINIKDIERIEIFKGPGSFLYGNNAMGGIINIITGKPDHRLKGAISSFYGTFNTYGGNMDLSGRFSKEDSGFYVRTSGHYLKSDGYISTPDEKRTQFTVKRFAEEGIGSFSAGYDFDRVNSIGLKIDYYNDKRGEGTKIYAGDGVNRDFDTWAYSLRYQGGAENMRWQAKAFWQNENYQRVSESLRGTTYTRFDVDSNRTDMGVDGSLSVQAFSNHLLTAGGDVREGRVDASDIYKTSPDRAHNEGCLRIYGFWLQDEMYFLVNKLSVVGGVRLDHAEFFDGSFFSTITPFNRLNGKQNKNSWTAFSPRLSARYKWTPEFSTYASYGRGFRASILDDLCRSGIMWGIYKVANPDLDPERIDSFELGLDYSPFKRLKITSSVYYSIGKDFLYYVPTGDSLSGRPLYRRENIDKVISYGLELDARFNLTKDITPFLNYTYSKAEIDQFDQRPAIEGQTLTRTPKHQVKGGITWLNAYVNMNLLGRYKSSQFVYTNEMTQTIAKIDGYMTFDAKIWKEVLKGLTLSVGAENLLNKKFLESVDDKAPGLFVLGEVSYRF